MTSDLSQNQALGGGFSAGNLMVMVAHVSNQNLTFPGAGGQFIPSQKSGRKILLN